MKKFLSIMLAILMIVTTMPLAFAAESTLTIEMTDTYGDGWEYAYIAVEQLVDGKFVKMDEATVSSETEVYEKIVSDEDIYRLVWFWGEYDEECAFVVKVNGEAVYEKKSGTDFFFDNGQVFIYTVITI